LTLLLEAKEDSQAPVSLLFFVGTGKREMALPQTLAPENGDTLPELSHPFFASHVVVVARLSRNSQGQHPSTGSSMAGMAWFEPGNW
jgi:hypothetical protein